MSLGLHCEEPPHTGSNDGADAIGIGLRDFKARIS